MRVDTKRYQLRQIYKNPQVKNSLNLILSVTATLFFIIFAIKPTLVTIASLKRKLKDEEQILALLDQKLTALQRAEKTYKQNEKYFIFLDNALPKEPEVIQFNLQLAYLAKIHNISLKSLTLSDFNLINKTYSTEKGPSEKQTLKISSSINASWADTKAFISELEKLDRIIKINNYSHRILSEEGGLINTSIIGEIYFYPNKDSS